MIVFSSEVDDKLIPQWLNELERHGMECEFHPDFSFTDQTGYLPIKLKILNPCHDAWINKHFLTGFEFYLDDFNLDTELKARQPKQSFWKSIFARGEPAVTPFVSKDIDSKLEKYNTQMSFVWGSSDPFALRVATISAAILAKLTGGLCTYQFEEWYPDTPETVRQFLINADGFERSLNPSKQEATEFDGWD